MANQTDGAQQLKAEAQVLTADEQDALTKFRNRMEPSDHSVIDESGEPVPEGELRQSEDGKFTDAEGKEVEQNKEGEWLPVKKWEHKTLDYMGDIWEYRAPKQLGAMFLGIASRKQASPKKKLDAIVGYLESTLSPKSMERIMDRSFDQEDEFDAEHMAHLVQKIAEDG